MTSLSSAVASAVTDKLGSNIKFEPGLNLKQKERAEKITKSLLEARKSGKQLKMIQGVFGDMEGCDGIIEEEIYPKKGGMFIRIYGCDHLFKGLPMRNTVEGIGLAKAMISILPQWTIRQSFLFKAALVLLYIFSKKRFSYYLRIYTWIIWRYTVGVFPLTRERYNKMTQNIRGVINSVICTRLDQKGIKVEEYKIAGRNHPETIGNYEENVAEIIANIGDFVALFLEYDNAYRFRLQDILVLKSNAAVKKDIKKEVSRLFDILMERETSAPMAEKWEKTRKIILFLLRIKIFREYFKQILTNLHPAEVGIDENDWYFCLRRKSFNFKGKTLEERLEIKDKIDKEKGHVFIQLAKPKA